MKRNAIIMAAGFSSRLIPLSLEKPKGLLEVKGEILIERQIKQLKDSGVEEIIIVTGYKKELFEYLKDKYNCKIIYNHYYKERNNHSSLFVAKEYLKNTYICSADNYFIENVFSNETSDNSYYASYYVNGKTDEWCIEKDQNNVINKVFVGGENSFIMMGHCFLNENDSNVLKKYLIETMNSNNKQYYWENILIDHINEFNIKLKTYNKELLLEFDTLDDLRSFDDKYKNTNNNILINISKENNCNQEDIKNIIPYKDNNEIIGFEYKINNIKFKYLFK